MTRFVAYLEKKSLLEPGLDEVIDEEIARGVTAFEATAAANPLGMFDHAYAELPPELAGERAELDARLAATTTRNEEGAGEPPLPPPMRGQRMSSRWQN